MLILPYLESVEESGHPLHNDLPRFAAYLDALGYGTSVKTYDLEQLGDLASREQENLSGVYDSPAAFAKSWLSAYYSNEISTLPSMIGNAIDWAQVWDKDLRHDYISVEIDDMTDYRWIFWRNH